MRLFIARIKGFIQYKDLMGQLVQRDLKLKYRRSVLGYLWSILNPLFIMIIMAIVFSNMFHNRNIPNYPVYLMSGQVLFNFMNISSRQALSTITGNAPLLKKTYLPKYVFVVSKVTSGLIDCIFSFGALLLVMIFTKGCFSWYLLLFPLIVFQLYVFVVGLGMFLGAMNVFFRDIQYIYNAVVTAWMYLTPMFYPVEYLPDKLHWLVVHLNPMYAYITQLRCLTLYGVFPDRHMILYGCIDAVLMLIFGTWVFAKKQDKFILYV